MPATAHANHRRSRRRESKAGPGQNKSPALGRPLSTVGLTLYSLTFMGLETRSSGSSNAGKSSAVVPPWTARFVLAGLAALLIAGSMTRIPAQPVSSSPEKGDAGFYQAVARRLQSAEPYYSAYGTEL